MAENIDVFCFALCQQHLLAWWVLLKKKEESAANMAQIPLLPAHPSNEEPTEQYMLDTLNQAIQ